MFYKYAVLVCVLSKTSEVGLNHINLLHDNRCFLDKKFPYTAVNLISKRLWEEDGQSEFGSSFYKEWISLKAKKLSYQSWIAFNS